MLVKTTYHLNEETGKSGAEICYPDSSITVNEARKLLAKMYRQAAKKLQEMADSNEPHEDAGFEIASFCEMRLQETMVMYRTVIMRMRNE
jgi:molybdopterin converting factor small subunit